MWIPIGIKDDDCVRCLQVEAKTSCSCAEDEDEVVRFGVVELFQEISTILCLGCSIQAKILEF
jgi:hypothetical protein